MLAAAAAQAADPQSYRVDLAATGDGAMDATLRATSELVSLRTTAPVSPFALIARARGEPDRLKTVLESYGYYQSKVTVTIEGMALDSGGIVDALTALPKGRDAMVAVSFDLGPLYHVRKVTVDGSIPAVAAGAFVLKSGAPAVAATVLASGARLLASLEEHGYAFAKVPPPAAYEDQNEPVLDVVFRVDAGARVNIGAIHIEGLRRLHENTVRRRLLIHSGQQYNSNSIEAARRDLLNLGVFAAISVKLGTAVDATGGVPVTFVVKERVRHAVGLNAAYSTDLGGSGGVTWTDRNVFGNAEQLTLAATLINLGGRATTGLGYDTSAKLTLPDFGHRDQSLQFSVGAIKQSLEAYDQKAVTSGATLTRKLSSVWSVSVGLTAEEEEITQQNPLYTSFLTTAQLLVVEPLIVYKYTLLAVPLTVTYDSTHLASPLDDPTHGMRNALSVTPTRSLGHPSATFVVSQIKLAAYFDVHELGLTEPGRTVLASRVLAGVAQGASTFSLPPDQRFYGGGSGTIRGYAYQAVGPPFPISHEFPNGYAEGGTSIEAATLEMRQRFGKSFGAAAFVDAGRVGSPEGSEARVGVGAGIRYYTSIGPIRFDVAVPTKHYAGPNSDSFEIYIGLGQAF